MAHTFKANERLTNHYNDDYAHLDQWSDRRFTFKILGGRQTENGNGFDYDGSMLYRVIGDKRLNQKAQERALYDSLSHHGCSHEYDCCECQSTTASIRRVGRGIFSVLLSYSRNY